MALARDVPERSFEVETPRHSGNFALHGAVHISPPNKRMLKECLQFLGRPGDNCASTANHDWTLHQLRMLQQERYHAL
jgi:hypothetical protein